MIALAKSKPGQLNYSSAGVGTNPHIAGELFNLLAGVDIVAVQYKGGGPADTAIIAGEVAVTFGNVSQQTAYVKAGRVRALAVTSAKRIPAMPELPTVAEAGVPGYAAVGWFGLLAPAQTPKAIVAQLSRDANRVLAEREVRERMEAMGAEPEGKSPEEFARFIRDDQAKWTKLMREAGIKPE